MVKIENTNKFQVGDKVWWFDAWGNMRWGIIYNIVDGKRGDTLIGKMACIHEEGKTGIHTGACLSDCWPSEEACLEAEERRVKEQIREYKESITNVKDLVRFLFEHQVTGEDMNYDAKAAASQRAKELLGLEIG